MRRLYYRTVRNNQILLLGKKLNNPKLNNGELDGLRFCFMPYPRAFEENGLTALWGTELLSRALHEAWKKGLSAEEQDKFLELLGEEDNKLLAPDGFERWYFWEMKSQVI